MQVCILYYRNEMSINIGTGKGWNDPDFLMTGGQVLISNLKLKILLHFFKF